MVGGKYLLENQETSTKTLHDDIFNKVEQFLINTEYLVRIPDDYDIKSDNVNLREDLTDNWFVLINGRVNINDYNRMRDSLSNYNNLATLISQFSIDAQKPALTKKIKLKKWGR